MTDFFSVLLVGGLLAGVGNLLDGLLGRRR